MLHNCLLISLITLLVPLSFRELKYSHVYFKYPPEVTGLVSFLTFLFAFQFYFSFKTLQMGLHELFRCVKFQILRYTNIMKEIGIQPPRGNLPTVSAIKIQLVIRTIILYP